MSSKSELGNEVRIVFLNEGSIRNSGAELTKEVITPLLPMRFKSSVSTSGKITVHDRALKFFLNPQ